MLVKIGIFLFELKFEFKFASCKEWNHFCENANRSTVNINASIDSVGFHLIDIVRICILAAVYLIRNHLLMTI